jgi:hypothetical protein
MIIYAAYGSNLSIGQFRARCPGALPIGSAVLPGYRLTFRTQNAKPGRWWGVANIDKDKKASVPVGLWLINSKDHLRALDVYEGFPTLYRREYLTVYPWSKRRRFSAPLTRRGVQALFYLMNPPLMDGIPAEIYERTIREGYVGFNLPDQALTQALEALEVPDIEELKEEDALGDWQREMDLSQ